MKRLYVLTRADLDLAYRSVQGGHAVAQFCLEHPESEWDNGYLIYLDVGDEGELKEWWGKLNFEKTMTKKDPEFSVFYEPDLNYQLTAIAVYTNGRMFRKLPIMTQEEVESE